LYNTNDAKVMPFVQVPADGCHGRCDDYYESCKQKV